MKFVRVSACLAASLWLVSATAHAHSFLVRSEPPAHASVGQVPPEVRLRFSEALEPDFVKVEIRLDDKPIASQPVPSLEKDGKTVRVRWTGGGPGAYAVDWDIVAKDGHRSKGRLEFTVKPH